MYDYSEHSAINILSNFKYLLFEVGVITIDLVDHGLLIGEWLDRLNALINNLVALLDFFEEQ
jgi:hypothetical protein